ncbi:poly-specific endoribonuclease [Lynx pardinus]|uniref:Uridylate-specific endoribonuclease n=1 Tax=Lynx pardinus TaxID=191816 RepID=A0A485NL02_LYNPA|nr:poly-specific endoribonuclease [Lynx pardinus]
MRACVPLIVAMLCSLAWAGKMESCASRCNEKFNRDAACQCDRRCPWHGDCCEDYDQLCTVEEDPNEPEPFLELEEETEAPLCPGLSPASEPLHSTCPPSLKNHEGRCEFSGTQGFDTGARLFHYLSCPHLSPCPNPDRPSRSSSHPTLLKLHLPQLTAGFQHLLRGQGLICEMGSRQINACKAPKGKPSTGSSPPTAPSVMSSTSSFKIYLPASHPSSMAVTAVSDLDKALASKLVSLLAFYIYCQNRYSSEQEFVSDLKNMWFGLYSRGNGEEDSSGFEHVFSGEVKKGKVTGFHNWIRFYMQEKEGLVDYYSHIYDGPWDSYPDVLAMQFNWDGYYKEVGSAFIGSSPEFEFALYSLCFIARPGKVCQLSLGGYPLAIQTYTWDKSTYGNGKKYIATAYVVSSTQ